MTDPQPEYCPRCRGNKDAQGRCHGSGCALPPPATEGEAAETTPPRATVQSWHHMGVTMQVKRSAGARTGHAGILTLAELEEFIEAVQELPGSIILVHQYGLRAVQTHGEGGPKLEWDDWT